MAFPASEPLLLAPVQARRGLGQQRTAVSHSCPCKRHKRSSKFTSLTSRRKKRPRVPRMESQEGAGKRRGLRSPPVNLSVPDTSHNADEDLRQGSMRQRDVDDPDRSPGRSRRQVHSAAAALGGMGREPLGLALRSRPRRGRGGPGIPNKSGIASTCCGSTGERGGEGGPAAMRQGMLWPQCARRPGRQSWLTGQR